LPTPSPEKTARHCRLRHEQGVARDLHLAMNLMKLQYQVSRSDGPRLLKQTQDTYTAKPVWESNLDLHETARSARVKKRLANLSIS
jgi:hypothetical protein